MPKQFINLVTAEVKGCKAYIDDVIIYSDNWTDHIKKLFDILKEAKLTINLAKREFGFARVRYLAHIV